MILMDRWQKTGAHTHTGACRLAGHCYSAVIRGLWVSVPPSTAVLFLSITRPICQQLTPPRWNLRRKKESCNMLMDTQTLTANVEESRFLKDMRAHVDLLSVSFN